MDDDHDDHDDHAARNRRWFGEIFDPSANLEALASVRDFGRRAVEEFADWTLPDGSAHERSDGFGSHAHSGGPASTTPEEWDRILDRFRGSVVRAGDVGLDLLDDALALITLTARRVSGGGPSGTSDTSRPLELTCRPGESSVGVFWVHNTSPVPVAEVRPHCGPLRAHTGVELPAAILHFDPVALAPLPGRSSCGLEVHCETPAGTPPGRYVTMILASGLPGLHLPLIVVVPEQDPGR